MNIFFRSSVGRQELSQQRRQDWHNEARPMASSTHNYWHETNHLSISLNDDKFYSVDLSSDSALVLGCQKDLESIRNVLDLLKCL